MSNQQIARQAGGTDLGRTEPIELGLADDGIVEVVLPVRSQLRAPEARAAATMVRAKADGRKRPLLLTVTGVLDINDGARAVSAAPETVSALALLGESPVDRVIAHFLLRVTPKSIPARFFTSEAAAREWLAGYLRES
ncbi:STAS/SEC14 domain-containing protein [Arthrobacter celericrescens]|uniref:DUF7793 family protein n=1 Tax=Arthrobacter celericrescens TaxID=2320851 RepID=UPI000EA3F0E9|nr:STAS/SEC14 domain-containing protein [Arthrobacter celericrescens]